MNILIFLSVLALCNCQAYFDDTTTQKPWPGPFANNKIGELVQDTPEVAQAKLEHERSYQEALANLPELPPDERYIPGPYEISQGVAQQQIRTGQMQAQQPYISMVPKTAPSQVQYLQAMHQYQQPQTQYQQAQPQYHQPEAMYKIDYRYQEPAADYQGKEQLHTSIYHQGLPEPEYAGEQYEYMRPTQNVQYQTGQEHLYNSPGAATERYLTAEKIPRSPLGETPEVAKARKEHLEAVEKAKAALKTATW